MYPPTATSDFNVIRACDNSRRTNLVKGFRSRFYTAYCRPAKTDGLHFEQAWNQVLALYGASNQVDVIGWNLPCVKPCCFGLVFHAMKAILGLGK